MPIEFGEDVLQNDDFIVETDNSGDLVQTHKQTGAQFKFDTSQNAWVPVEGLHLDGEDIVGVGSIDAVEGRIDRLEQALDANGYDISGVDNFSTSSIEVDTVGTNVDHQGNDLSNVGALEAERLESVRYANRYPSIQEAIDDLAEIEVDHAVSDVVGAVRLPGLPEGYTGSATVGEGQDGVTIRGDGLGTYWTGDGSDHTITLDARHVSLTDLYLSYDGDVSDDNDVVHLESINTSTSQDHRVSNLVIDGPDSRFGLFDDSIRSTIKDVYIRSAGEAGAKISGAQGEVSLITHPHQDTHYTTHLMTDGCRRYDINLQANLTGQSDQIGIHADGCSWSDVRLRADCDPSREHTAVLWDGGSHNMINVIAQEAHRGLDAASSDNNVEISYRNSSHDDARGINLQSFASGWNINGRIELAEGGRGINISSGAENNTFFGWVENQGDSNKRAISCPGDENVFIGVFIGDIVVTGENNYIAGLHIGDLNVDDSTNTDSLVTV